MMDEWKPRFNLLAGGCEVPRYDNDDEFTIKMYHGGMIVGNAYEGGGVAYFDKVDRDKISLIEIDSMVHVLGYEGNIDYWFMIGSTDDAMTKLKYDNDAVTMCCCVPEVRLVIVYLDHLELHEPQQLRMEKPMKEKVGTSGVKMLEVLGGTQGTTSTIGLNDGDCTVVDVLNEGEHMIEPGQQRERDRKGKKIVLQEDEGRETSSEVLDNDNEEEYEDSRFRDDNYGTDDDEIELYVPINNEVNESEVCIEPTQAQNAGEASIVQQRNEMYVDSHLSLEAGTGGRVSDGVDNEPMFDYVDSDNESVGGEINSDGEVVKKKYPSFNPKTDMKDPKFEIGMQFATAKIFRAAVRERGILDGWEAIFVKSARTRVRIICSGEDCPYEIFASKMQNEDTLQIKTYQPKHTCYRIWENRNVTEGLLAARFQDRIKLNVDWKVDSLAQTMSADVRAKVSKQKAYRAKMRALKVLEGTIKAQYSRISDYGNELIRAMPGTTIDIKCDYDNPGKLPVFKRMYICLEPLKIGFKTCCRKMIGLDGCHLRGCYGGQLLIAVGIDANNSTWVIAYAMVEIESKDSWVWFIELLATDCGIKEGAGWTFISDKQKGLVPAFDVVIPYAEHRFCVRHLWTNFNNLFKGKALKDQMWKCAYATTKPYYHNEMKLMLEMKKEAYDWLKDPERPPEQWSKAHFSTHLKCDIILNNLCESFNSFILDARKKPIVSMMEEIRVKLMKRIHFRRDMMMKFDGEICPKPRKILEKNKLLAATDCIPTMSGGLKVEVDSISGSKYAVDLAAMSCPCRKWDLSGIPCKHAISAINHLRQRPESYVDKCYMKKTYIDTYNNIVLQINGMDLWERSAEPPILPPSYTRQPGRPPQKRKKDASEKEYGSTTKLGKEDQTSVKCGGCGLTGHNILTCHRQKPPSSKKRKVSSTQVSNSEIPTQTGRPKLSQQERMNRAREKAKENRDKIKAKREDAKAAKTSQVSQAKRGRPPARSSTAASEAKSAKPARQRPRASTDCVTGSKNASSSASTTSRSSSRVRKPTCKD